MSRPLTASQYAAAMKKWDVPHVFRSGYANRGRPGSFTPRGIMIHHTASSSQSDSYLDFLFRNGRSDLPAPLCHAATSANGNVYTGALGRANHAGRGSLGVFNKVKGDKASMSWTEKPGPDVVDGNANFYGNEVMYAGTKPMSDVQYRAVVRWCAAVCDAHGWTAGSIIGHKEWTKRKVDPGQTSMAKLRRDVQALLDGPTKELPKTGTYKVRITHTYGHPTLNSKVKAVKRSKGKVLEIRQVRVDKYGRVRGRTKIGTGMWYIMDHLTPIK